MSVGGKWSLWLPAALLALAGCSASARVRTDDSPNLRLSPIAASAVRVYYTREAETPYDVVGLVYATADAGEDASIPIGLLCHEAAALGADGIVETSIAIAPGQWKNGVSASGVAVRFQKGTP